MQHSGGMSLVCMEPWIPSLARGEKVMERGES